jgi:hypothetical protein
MQPEVCTRVWRAAAVQSVIDLPSRSLEDSLLLRADLYSMYGLLVLVQQWLGVVLSLLEA